jgi:hypothetical protein
MMIGKVILGSNGFVAMLTQAPFIIVRSSKYMETSNISRVSSNNTLSNTLENPKYYYRIIDFYDDKHSRAINCRYCNNNIS